MLDRATQTRWGFPLACTWRTQERTERRRLLELRTTKRSSACYKLMTTMMKFFSASIHKLKLHDSNAVTIKLESAFKLARRDARSIVGTD